MQVATVFPGVVPNYVADKAGYLAQDWQLPGDNEKTATLMAKFFVDTYVHPTILSAEAVTTPATGFVDVSEHVAESRSDHVAEVTQVEPVNTEPVTTAVQAIVVDLAEATASPQPCPVEPTATVDLVESAQEEKVQATVVAVAEDDSQSRCCLENCDRILPNLYLGGMEAAVDAESLAQQGVRAVVCCNREFEFATSKYNPELDYYRVDVEDMGREPIELFFPEATEFIHKHLSEERPVLIHCKAGVSRSASVLLAYLIEYCGYSLHDAFMFTLERRPTITPNPGFMTRLREYEKEILGTTDASIDMHQYVAWFQAPERSTNPQLKIRV